MAIKSNLLDPSRESASPSAPSVDKLAYVKPDVTLLGTFSALTNGALSGPRVDGARTRP